MAHRTIRWDVQGYVVRVGCAVEIRGVAARTGIRGICVIPSGMTKDAIIGNRNVCSRKWINCIVVKSRRRPGRFRVASCAICWELVYDVIGVTHAVVVGLVAAYAGVWCVVIVSSGMASCAIVGNCRVCPVQSVIIIVNREAGRIPARLCRMAHGTISRQA